MIICFTETESESERFFDEHLQDHAIGFFSDLEEIPVEMECLSIFINSRITTEFLKKYSQLLFIATRSTGVDHIDLEACDKRGIAVSYVPTYGENSVAEHTFALLLAISRRIRQALTTKRRGQFSLETFRGFDLKDKTIELSAPGASVCTSFELPGLSACRQSQPIPNRPVCCRKCSVSNTFPSTSCCSAARSYRCTRRSRRRPCTCSITKPLRSAGRVLLSLTPRAVVSSKQKLCWRLWIPAWSRAPVWMCEDERLFRSEASRLVTDRIVIDLQQISSPEEMHIRHPERLAEIQRLTANESLLSRPNVIFTPHIAFNSAEAVQRINEVTLQNIVGFTGGASINLVAGRGTYRMNC